LYSLIGAASDLDQTTGADQPDIDLADLNGRTRLTFDGANHDMQRAFPLDMTGGLTMILGGLQQVTWSLNDYITDGFVTETIRFYQATSTPRVRMRSGATGPTAVTELQVATDAHVKCLYNGAASNMVVNNGTPITGDVGTNVGANGFSLGSNSGGTANSNIKVGLVVLIQGALTAPQETAIYNFSKNAYGTP
jgi:hypothetical protein